MTVASFFKAVIYPHPHSSVPAEAILKPGDLLNGRVAEITGSGKVLIEFGNLRVLADTDLAFHPGERIRVRVEEIGEQIKLKHLHSSQPEAGTTKAPPDLTGSLLDRLVHQLPAVIDRAVQADRQAAGRGRMPDPVRQALLTVRNFLQPSLATVGSTEIAALLKNLVENSGFFFEKRMESILGQPDPDSQGRAGSLESKQSQIRQVLDRDLKPNLLVLNKFLRDSSGRSPAAFAELDDLKPNVGRLLAGIERQQNFIRTHPPDAETPPVFSVLFHLKKTSQKGMLKVFMGSRNKKGESAGSRITVMLNMDRIGEIQSDLYLLDKSLQITFRVGNENVKRVMEKEIDRFREVMTKHFRSVRVDVRLHPRLRQERITQTADVFSDRQIDLRV